MKNVRYYTALIIRIFAFICKLPSAVLYDLSNVIKNQEDEFNF